MRKLLVVLAVAVSLFASSAKGEQVRVEGSAATGLYTFSLLLDLFLPHGVSQTEANATFRDILGVSGTVTGHQTHQITDSFPNGQFRVNSPTFDQTGTFVFFDYDFQNGATFSSYAPGVLATDLQNRFFTTVPDALGLLNPGPILITSISVTPVPELETYMMFLVGLLMVTVVVKRSRQYRTLAL